MRKRPVLFLLLFTAIILLLILIMQPLQILQYRESIDLLFPKGIIALEQRNLLLLIQVLMLLVIIPVYILTFVFSWRYRAGNEAATYDPDLVDNKMAEYIWWGLPLVMTLVIGAITWVKTYELDPYKPLASENRPITIQVVALQWKWLFIYPQEKIATLNFVQFPKETPIHFEITADAPMNSFWIPALGGQIYAMPKMRTELFLMASEVGDFRGSSANLSGEGFAGMHFISRASTKEEYEPWVKAVRGRKELLTKEEYEKLALPSQDNPVALYQLQDETLFDTILMKYMEPK